MKTEPQASACAMTKGQSMNKGHQDDICERSLRIPRNQIRTAKLGCELGLENHIKPKFTIQQLTERGPDYSLKLNWPCFPGLGAHGGVP
jgi:hypothetical protein